MNTSGLKALILLAAVLPLVGAGNQAAGLAPGQKTLEATGLALGAPSIFGQGGPPPGRGGGGEEEEEEEPAEAAAAPDVPAAPTDSDETRRLERALNELAQADAEALADLRAAFEDEVDEVDQELDDLEADLDERDAELDEVGDLNGVDGSPQFRRAVEKLRELDDAVRSLRRQLHDIRRRALDGGDLSGLLSEVRALGAAIAGVKHAERFELEALIEAAEDRERGGPPEDRGKPEDAGPPEGAGEEEPSPSPEP